jgi:hypothetical protein
MKTKKSERAREKERDSGKGGEKEGLNRVKIRYKKERKKRKAD